MLLALDVGNTNITVGVFTGEKLSGTWRVATGIHRMPDEYGSLLLDLLERQCLEPAQVKEAVICTVVPPLREVFVELCDKYFRLSPLVVEAGVKTGVRILTDNPREVGPDRIVNAAAAHHLYGGPVIVIDLGTAITFDAVSREGDYLGGAITPGIAVATEALFNRTAMLPRVELVRPAKAIGRSTIAAMQSGIVFGYVGLIEGIVSRICQELTGEVKIVATGGHAGILAKETPVIQVVNPDLTLVGLKLIHQLNKS